MQFFFCIQAHPDSTAILLVQRAIFASVLVRTHKQTCGRALVGLQISINQTTAFSVSKTILSVLKIHNRIRCAICVTFNNFLKLQNWHKTRFQFYYTCAVHWKMYGLARCGLGTYCITSNFYFSEPPNMEEKYRVKDTHQLKFFRNGLKCFKGSWNVEKTRFWGTFRCVCVRS